jgi:UDPglucose--hexose-1-phosphate uridylyltransferase
MSKQDNENQENIGTRELRINPIVPTESVLIATARSMRPQKAEEAAPRDTRHHVERCPFCRGNEEKTPPEITRTPKQGDWAIRIVENLYPVLGDDRQNPNMVFGLQQAINGYGRHEVVVDHSQHGIAIHEMSPSHLSTLFQTYQVRMKELYDSDERLKYVLVFKNFGPAAGASMAHTHSQIIATPVIPQNVQDEVTYSKQYYEKHHNCIFCTLIDEALTYEATIYDRDSGQIVRKIDVGQYVVERGEHFIAIKPFASRYEWEVHILPLVHKSDFLKATKEEFDDFARVLKRTMQRLDAVIGGAQYNYFLHTNPLDKHYDSCQNSYHWHLEICPRTSIPSGFELGSGLFINTVSPEEAAKQLTNVELEEYS